MIRLLMVMVLAAVASAQAATDVFPEPDVSRFSGRRFDDHPEWVEDSVSLPAFPQDADLIEFPVSAATTNHFFIDGATLTVGKDRVVRFTLVVKAAGGATNVSYEGIRCDTRSLKRYAVGRADGTWAWLRSGDWQLIESKPTNRQYVALNRDFFCPLSNPITSVEAGRDALRRGQHPDASMRGIYER